MQEAGARHHLFASHLAFLSLSVFFSHDGYMQKARITSRGSARAHTSSVSWSEMGIQGLSKQLRLVARGVISSDGRRSSPLDQQPWPERWSHVRRGPLCSNHMSLAGRGRVGKGEWEDGGGSSEDRRLLGRQASGCLPPPMPCWTTSHFPKCADSHGSFLLLPVWLCMWHVRV